MFFVCKEFIQKYQNQQYILNLITGIPLPTRITGSSVTRFHSARILFRVIFTVLYECYLSIREQFVTSAAIYDTEQNKYYK